MPRRLLQLFHDISQIFAVSRTESFFIHLPEEEELLTEDTVTATQILANLTTGLPKNDRESLRKVLLKERRHNKKGEK